MKKRNPPKQSAAQPTSYDAFVQRCKNNKWIVPLLLLVVAVVGIAAFTDALGKIRAFFKSSSPETQPIQSMANSPGGMQAGRDIVINSNTPAAVVVLRVVETDPLEFRQKHEGVQLLFGGNTIGLPPVPAGQTAKKDVGRAFLGAGTHENPSRIELIATHQLIVFNIEFFPLFGMPHLKLENNQLSGLPSNWDCNHSKRGIEVVNEKLIPVFQLYYKDDSHIVFNGAITFPTGAVFIAEGKGQSLKLNHTFSPTEFFWRVEELGIKKIFRYPAWQHPGEYADK